MAEPVDSATPTLEQPANPEASVISGETSGSVPESNGAQIEQLIFTISAGGDVTNAERIDATGLRADLPVAELGRYAGDDGFDEVNAALEAGFEAGILEALGDDDLEPVILFALHSRRSSHGLGSLRRGILRRLLLRRLIRHLHNPKGESTE
jgi:hypothetical protein